MKIHSLFIALLCSIASYAANTTTTIEQVTETVTLTDDVDYVITSTTPFTTEGLVNIVNTTHAVLIFTHVKPSVVISKWLKYVKINGATARNNTNCQVKLYSEGAIILPYGSATKPLTCYTEPNFEGKTCTNYGTGNTGGYMNSLTASTLLNNIRSFKLRRGYMVTFAVGTGGWGYSRCFIADTEDLEIAELPHVLDGRISSYRIFPWYYTSKKGLASDNRKAANAAVGSTWCYDWGQGNEGLLPDVEWVPNHIYEDWPSSATCGSVTQSCHMKTNNEPGNSADDTPQDVATVLANWQNLMRTGLRLCSESSHDGSMGHLKEFIDSIDARGWRCDILDLHCYWASGFDSGNLNWYSDHYGNGRPIWISEWIWGASWNKNGCFGNGVTDTQILNTTKDILTSLNKNPRVERYAYWNSESKGKIYTSSLTALGEYYASMETGLAYNKAGEYIPKVVYRNPSKPSATYTKSTHTVQIKWTDPNGDMLDSIVVECKLPNATSWEKRGNVTPKDKTSASDISYTFSERITEPGLYTYRVVEYYERKTFSADVKVTLSAAQNVGLLQYGELKMTNTDAVSTDLNPQDKAPYVVTGMVSNNNQTNGITNHLMAFDKSTFKFRLLPWKLNTPVNISQIESIHYMILPSDTIIQFTPDMMLISANAGNVSTDEVQVTFPQPFPEGVTPVVIAQQNTTSTTSAPVIPRIYNVTNTGFSIKLLQQEGVTTALSAQNVNYFACSPGQASLGMGKMLTVGINTARAVGGSARQDVAFVNATGDTLHFQSPYIIAAAQTDRYPEKVSVFRQHSTLNDELGLVWGINVRRQIDPTATSTVTNRANTNGDYIGYFIISDDPEATGDEPPVIVPTGIEGIRMDQSITNNAVFDLSGRHVSSSSQSELKKGIYIKRGRKVVKL